MQQLNYKQFGEGKPLVILHGLFGSLDNWQTLAKKWSEFYSVYIVDLPNHGKSYHTNTFSYDEMANAVANLCDDLGLTDITLLGHSMGGKTAMNFALNHPDKLGELIVVDIAPKPYAPHHDQILEGLFSITPSELKNRKEADEIMGKIIEQTGVRLFLLKNLKRAEGGGFEWKMNLNLLSREVNKVIETTPIQFPLNVPALFIRGELSGYILDTDFDDIYEKFPQAEIETIAGAGHWVHAEKPTELFELIRAFV